jgi:hypothetical protein
MSTASSQSSIPVLHYFDIRGKAEAIRLLWEEAGQEYKVPIRFISNMKIFKLRLKKTL